MIPGQSLQALRDSTLREGTEAIAACLYLPCESFGMRATEAPRAQCPPNPKVLGMFAQAIGSSVPLGKMFPIQSDRFHHDRHAVLWALVFGIGSCDRGKRKIEAGGLPIEAGALQLGNEIMAMVANANQFHGCFHALHDCACFHF